MTTHKLRTQNMVKLEISTLYNTRVTVQIWRETMKQTNGLCKSIQFHYFHILIKKTKTKQNK